MIFVVAWSGQGHSLCGIINGNSHSYRPKEDLVTVGAPNYYNRVAKEATHDKDFFTLYGISGFLEVI